MTDEIASGPDDPVTTDEFFRLMKSAGIHPDGGRVAVAVSGGADSMSLALLARSWGDAVALTFDHGLRAESADEAQRVACWMYDRGVTHQVLGRRGIRPSSDIQAAARNARYTALEGWCRQNKVATLLLGHHLEDQAETVIIRLARGSGIDGLSAMSKVAPPITGDSSPRLVRPFLEIPKSRLRATLNILGQKWIEDPSNQQREYLRIRVRDFLATTDIEGLTPARLAKTAASMRRARTALQNMTDRVLAEAVDMHQAGYARVMLAPIIEAEDEIALRALSRMAMCYGGRDYPPRLESIERLLDDLRTPDYAGSTVGGIMIEPDTSRDADNIRQAALRICREAGTITAEADLQPGEPQLWDGRFQVRIDGGRGRVSKLGDAGWASLSSERPELKEIDMPHPVRLSLPALRINSEIVAVPQLGYDSDSGPGLSAMFAPARPLFEAKTAP